MGVTLFGAHQNVDVIKELLEQFNPNLGVAVHVLYDR